MIHVVTQAANRAAAIVKWLETSPAAVINQLDRHWVFTAIIQKNKHCFTPPYTQSCHLLQFKKRLHLLSKMKYIQPSFMYVLGKGTFQVWCGIETFYGAKCNVL